jgi:hypothetical protein
VLQWLERGRDPIPPFSTIPMPLTRPIPGPKNHLIFYTTM